MSLLGVYDSSNIFAKIIRGEASAVRIFEDAHILAFMDLFPQSRGHALVISKTAKARNLLDVSEEELSRVMAGVRRLARGVHHALAPEGVLVTQFNGEAAGQTVFHLHVHVIPRYAATDLKPHAQGPADLEDLKHLADQIRNALDR
jgi:histidine triad (HIT) family protein